MSQGPDPSASPPPPPSGPVPRPAKRTALPPAAPSSQPASGWYARLEDWFRGEIAWLDGFLKRWFLRFCILCLHLTLVVGACCLLVWGISRGRIYTDVEEIPSRYCGVVLGCVKKVNGRDNVFFVERVKAAAKLYHAQKLQYLIVSGDNSRDGYNEPADMKEALVALGVPASHIYCDYAGFRTLDSVVRARQIFGQVDYTIISQGFHNPRAVYLARRLGVPNAVAFSAKGASADAMLMVYLRELGARVMAVLDAEILQTQPKFLGDKILIGTLYPPVDAVPTAMSEAGKSK